MRQLSQNERRLIELVATSGPIARTDLAIQLGLTGATVTRTVAALDELGLFDERPDRQGTDGPPKRLMQMRSGRYFAAGLTFSRKSIEFALLDLAGHIVGRESVAIADQPALSVAEAAATKLSQLLADRGVPQEALVGMACAMPINFGPGGETVTAHGVFPELVDPAVMDRFLTTFDMPILLENDGKTSAIGEHVYGRQPGDGRSLYLLHLAHGVGGGAVIDGVPFYGANGNSCLPGFLFPLDRPRPSGLDLVETLVAAGYPVEDFGDIDPLIDNCPEIEDWIQRASEQLARAVVAVTGFLDPTVIVIGGRLPHRINERLVARVRAMPLQGPSTGINVTPVRASTLGPEGGALGAACLPLYEKFFNGHARGHEFRYFQDRGRRNVDLPKASSGSREDGRTL